MRLPTPMSWIVSCFLERPSAPSSSMLEMAHGHVSVEMNVLLSIRVSFAVQEWIGVIQVAVLIVCEAKSLIRGLQDAYSPRTQCPHD